MAIINNPALEQKYIDNLTEMKRYLRDEAKFNALVELADKNLDNSDYEYQWKIKRTNFIKTLISYFKLHNKEVSSIKAKRTSYFNGSYTVDIRITGTAVKPKYCIGTNELEYTTLWSGLEDEEEEDET